MLTDIEIQSAAKLYVPQCLCPAFVGARSWLYSGLDSMRARSCELSRFVMSSGNRLPVGFSLRRPKLRFAP